MTVPVSAGTLIDGRYRVLSRIGSGGMADVYCAEDSQLGRRVAVKLLHERFARDEEFVERFRREASSAASLAHANIVGVFDRGEWAGTYYIAMEFLDGRSLDAIVREEAPLDPQRAIDITDQVLRAARFAHRRGVIHRDLKPHNVIVDDEGRVKVTDFGIARAGASEITQTGSIMGTARYLSPEQAQGHEVSPRSDVYAIGILLYELLTGTVPFEGDSVVAIALRHLSEPPRRPSSIVSSISPQLDAIVLRALAKDPADRFADAEEFAAALAVERERLRTEDGGRTAAFAPLPAPPTALVPAYSSATRDTQIVPGPYAGRTEVIDHTFSGVYPPGATFVTERERHRAPVWPWALLGVALAAAAVVIVLFVLVGTHKTVPDVHGDSESVASAQLGADGFVVAPTTANSSTVPAGEVISQTPTPGSQVAKGSTVRIVISSGPANGKVPNFVGRASGEARFTLTHQGYKVVEQPQSSSSVANGHVIAMSPPGGSTAAHGSTVVLTVSTGAPMVVLVNTVGEDVATARATLEGAGFQVKVKPVQNTTVPAGQVLTQNPTSAKARQGSTVKLTVASAPTTVTVPYLLGETSAAAGAQLAGLGLAVTQSSTTTNIAAQEGIVLHQKPKSGKAVKPGSSVHIVVGQYVAPTPTGPSGASGPGGSTAPTGAT